MPGRGVERVSLGDERLWPGRLGMGGPPFTPRCAETRSEAVLKTTLTPTRPFPPLLPLGSSGQEGWSEHLQ